MVDNCTILVVDEHAEEAPAAMVLGEYYRVVGVADRQAAVEAGFALGRELALLVICNPVGEIDRLPELMKSQGEHMSLPVLYMSDTAEPDPDADGMTVYLPETCSTGTLLSHVRSLIRLYNAEVTLRRVELDPVTGVYNRGAFYTYASRRLAMYPEQSFDMVCLEIESYRSMVKRYGTERCEMMLRSFVNNINRCIPERVIVGRISDAWFAMLYPHVTMETYEEMMTLSRPALGSTPLPRLTVNAGVYQNVDRSLPMDTICINALLPIDRIRYRHGIYLAAFDHAIKLQYERDKEILYSMSAALQEQQFIVYYQPKYELFTETIVGAEALVRWVHPAMGFMHPGDFIPLLESNGMIFDVDCCVLTMVCADIRRWLDEGKMPLPVSVNVSQIDFDHPDLAVVFTGIIDRYRIPHELIHFEITESADARDMHKKREITEKLHMDGFQIELDDFGSGYSNIRSLSELPIDVMKVDMSLISHMFEPVHSSVLRGALYTAAALGIPAVAEGVETKAQSELLKKMCRGKVDVCIQGAYYARPMPGETFKKLLLSVI